MTHRRQARGGTTAHDKVHRRAPHGHQGIMDLGPHHREAACLMGPHGYRLTCLGASLSVPAPHSLRTANFGPVGPMCQSGGSCVFRAVPWLVIGLHTVSWTAEACLAAAGLMHCELWCRLASYGAPTALEHFATGVCPVVSGVKMGPSAYTNDTVPSPGCVLQGLRLW